MSLKTRIASRSDGELLQWASLAASGMMRHIEDFEQSGNTDNLREVKLSIPALEAVVNELILRKEARDEDG